MPETDLFDVGPFGWPSAVVPTSDLQATRWLQDPAPWRRWRPHASLVGQFVPLGYSAYVRINHPAWSYPARLLGTPWHQLHSLGHPVRWDDAAHAQGKSLLGTELRFEDVLPQPQHPTPDDQTPELPMGLSPEVIAALIPVLRGLTHTPETTWLAFWDGTGKWDDADFPNTFDDRSRADYADRCRQREAFARSIRSLPRWAPPGWGATGRHYWLAHGPLTAAWDVARSIYQAEPNFWWPEDKAWCLVWEIDFDFSIIGTTTDGAARLLALPDVETALVSAVSVGWREF